MKGLSHPRGRAETSIHEDPGLHALITKEVVKEASAVFLIPEIIPYPMLGFVPLSASVTYHMELAAVVSIPNPKPP